MDTSSTVPRLKIWPQLGLRAIKTNRSGAWRLWELARHLDEQGSGRVELSSLRKLIVTQAGAHRSTFSRWLRQAENCGAIVIADEYVYYVNLGRMAAILGAERITRPAAITTETLIRQGWRKHVWAGYLATVATNPISQRTKKQLTGISARTQARYQRGIGHGRKNFVPRGEGTQKNADAYRELFFLTVFCNDGRLIQRHPDIRIVPMDTALSLPRGRSQRRAQKYMNSLMLLAQGNRDEAHPRLYFANDKAAARAIQRNRDYGREPMPGDEVFLFRRALENANQWERQ